MMSINSHKCRRIFLSPPHMSGEEINFIKEAFNENYISPLGPQVEAFEKDLSQRLGFCYALALTSGTASLHIALRSIGVGRGDTVIASSLTFIGSVSPIIFLNAHPVFIDSARSTWNMDLEILEKAIKDLIKKGEVPKAVVPTDLYGQCNELDKMSLICQQYNIPIIADSCEALGSSYKGRSAGYGAKAAVFSFNGNKIITTSAGGMLVSDDEGLISLARYLSRQAREPLPHYEHNEIGYNYSMSNILAAIGRGQLKVLGDRVARKRHIFSYYREALEGIPGIEFMPEAPQVVSNRWLTAILITPDLFGCGREEVRLALERENIESRPVWKPMHLQPVFKNCQMYGGKVSEDLFNRGLCLPSGTSIRNAEIDRVIQVILDLHKP